MVPNTWMVHDREDSSEVCVAAVFEVGNTTLLITPNESTPSASMKKDWHAKGR